MNLFAKLRALFARRAAAIRSPRTWYPVVHSLTPLRDGSLEMRGICAGIMAGDIVHATTQRSSVTYRVLGIDYYSEYADPTEFIARVTPEPR